MPPHVSTVQSLHLFDHAFRKETLMAQPNDKSWLPFRPNPEDIKAVAEEVSEISAIQKELLDKDRDLHVLDRVAHQYQIAGSKVFLKLAHHLPAEVQDV